MNAEKLLALLNAVLVNVVRPGKNYRFYINEDHGRYCFDCTDRSGQKTSDTYRYVVNARG
jgi:hypothetical protein